MPATAPLPMSHPYREPAPSSGARLLTRSGETLPLRDARLDVRAGGGLARAVLTQRFVNPEAAPLHVTYLLPLPADGAVSGFAFTMDGVRIVGEVDLRRHARERFETALARGQTAALLEQDRSDLFTQEIGNVPAHAEIVVEIEVDQPLRWLEEGAWELRFPTVVGARYVGEPGRVEDAARTVVHLDGGDVGARAALQLRISDETSGPIESPSHRVTDDDGVVRFRDARLDRDVVVRWPVGKPEPSATLALARPADARHEGATYGLITLVPPRPGAVVRAQPRDLTLLIDTSGSMHGAPLAQVQRIALALIDSLRDEDRLEMIAFSSRPHRFRAEPIRASRDGKKAASRWVEELRAGGATEMHAAVLEALRPLRPGAQRQIVLMTDGYIGFEREIVGTLLHDAPEGVRLHTVGVGAAPNRSLTRAAARAGRGVELLVGNGEDAERVGKRLLARTVSPLVTDLVIEGAEVIAPRHPGDLYAGCPTSFAVQLADGASAITVRGRTTSGAFERTLDVHPVELGHGSPAIATRFGRERVEDVETTQSAGFEEHNERVIEQLGLRFSIATRLTSWIAVTQEVSVLDPERTVHRRQPHELVDGTRIESLGLRRCAPDAGLLSLHQPMSLEVPRGPLGAPAKAAPRHEGPVKRRHGSLRVWLVILVLLASMAALAYWLLARADRQPEPEAAPTTEVTPASTEHAAP